MTTLILQSAGSALGGLAGGPLGAGVGRALGGLAGSALDDALRPIEGPRLKDIDGLTSTEGAPIPRVYGRARIGGQLIWATRFEEVAVATVERSGRRGGKSFGGGGGTAAETVANTTYAYFANLAVGLCEGPIAFVRRVWADSRELDLTALTMRLHRGDEGQPPDPLIVAKEGAGNAPAYRGLAYVVFERLPLAAFGNRVPQFSFEVVRPVEGLGAMIRAVCLIPGATEFGYDVLPVSQSFGLGATAPENRHQFQATTDIVASLDALQALCPNLKRVSLVVSWFGDDLRAGHCTIAPRVESAVKITTGDAWSVAGLARAAARVVSTVNGTPAYGGTPSDAGVVRLIGHLKERGLEVVLYPFVMMDIAPGNGLADPYADVTDQPPYPWRGRITCDPAPGRPGTVDGTSAAADQVQAFFDAYRAMILHYAGLAAAAGVDGFILGSELVGLTRVRSGPGAYPAVAELQALATEARAVLGPGPKIAYAADWTEYGAHALDGGTEVRFPLDPLWAHPAIDAVGIDFYPPISDWRDGADHADLGLGRSVHDRDYLRGRLGAGEAFDWFYASEADRLAQARTPIADGAHGKPWVFRPKDLVGWWSNPHVERVGGVEQAATAWTPRAKPIWLTEVGVPAVDKGPNGPNVFPDPKSSESARPPLSNGARDDLVQVRALEALLSRFDPALPGFSAASNPVSPLYGGPMIDPEHVFVWAWDARPYPAFPDFDHLWADGLNWQAGHWITGRLEGVALDRLIAAVLKDFGIDAPAALPLDGFLNGAVIDRPLSAREVLEPLARLFGFDAVASGGVLSFRGRGGRAVTALRQDDLVLGERGTTLRLVRAQETELPAQVELGFTDGEGDYRRAAVASRRVGGSSRREARADAAVVTRRAEAQRLADAWLQDLWAGRESADFTLSPRQIALEPGDIVSVPTQAGPRLHRVTRIADGPTRRVSTRAVEPSVFATPGVQAAPSGKRPPPVAGRPSALVLDLPAARGEATALQWLAVAADPWPGAVAVWRSGDGASFALHRIVALPAVIGRTLTALPPGPLWRWDPLATVDVEVSSGALASIGDAAALAGGNLFAVQGLDGRWEIVSAAQAELIGTRRYRLSRMLRGLAGSEPQAARSVPSGATLVRLDEAVAPLADDLADLGQPWRYRIGPASRDHADPSYVEVTAIAGADALRPLAPVHVRARRGPEGVTIAWVRRTRRHGDAWEPADVPLGEDAERYEIDVLQGGAALRVLASAVPTALYPAAQEVADFGTPQATLALRVAQVSPVVGRGFETAVIVPVM